MVPAITSTVLAPPTAKIGSHNNIFRSTIGKYTYTGDNTHIIGAEVCNYCSISWNVTIGGQEHPTDRFTTHPLTYVRNWGVPETYLKDYNEFKEPVRIERCSTIRDRSRGSRKDHTIPIRREHKGALTQNKVVGTRPKRSSREDPE